MPEVYRIPVPYAYRCGDCLETPCERHSPEYISEIFRAHVAPESVAAVIVEPVLGEGGFVIPPPDYFPGLKRICEEHGILFIADEVQTGFARTGRMFAIEHFGVEPDIMITAKSLSGGTPLSALTGRAEVMDAPPLGSLGGTYGGNPLACRAALAAIEVIEKEGLVARAQELGARVLDRFRAMQERYKLIGDVRGLGAMVAMELVKDRGTKEPAGEETARIIHGCYESGLIVLKAGAGANVVQDADAARDNGRAARGRARHTGEGGRRRGRQPLGGGMAREHPFLLAGEWQRSDRPLEVRSPYNGEVVGVTFVPTEQQVEEAIQRAVSGFERDAPALLRGAGANPHPRPRRPGRAAGGLRPHHRPGGGQALEGRRRRDRPRAPQPGGRRGRGEAHRRRDPAPGPAGVLAGPHRPAAPLPDRARSRRSRRSTSP